MLHMPPHHAVNVPGGGQAPRPYLPGACAALVAWAMTLPGAATGESPAARIRRFAITPPVESYVTSAAWLPGEERLLITDPRYQRLLLLPRRDGPPEEVRQLPGEERPLAGLTTAWAAGGVTHLLINDWERREVWHLHLDAKLGVTQRLSVHSWRLEPAGRITRLKGMVELGGWAYMQAGFKGSESGERFGLLRMRAQAPRQLEFLADYPLNSGARVVAADFSLLANAGGNVFFLELGSDPPHIAQLAPQRRRLKAFPPGYGPPPDAPPGAQARDAAWAHLTAMESAFMPAGLYAHGEALLLLTREPRGEGKTEWRLHRLNPRADRLEGSVQLPTQAPAILLAPGEKRWAIVELGPLHGVMERTLASWVELPVAWLDTPAPTPTPRPPRPGQG